MDKYQELKMLQKYVQKYKEQLEENIEAAKEDIKSYGDISIDDKKRLEIFAKMIAQNKDYTEQLAECENLLKGLREAEAGYTVMYENETLEEEKEKDTNLKRALFKLKAQYRGVLAETFLDLSYKYGNYGSLETEEEQEKFEAELDDSLANGHITQEEYDELTYGISFCQVEEPKQEKADSKPIEEESRLNYNPEADRGDNSYEELQTMRTIIEQYIQRETISFERTKQKTFQGKTDQFHVEMLQDAASNKQKGTDILGKLQNLEMFISAASTMEPEQAQKLFEQKFKEFKETNFDELTTIMSDTYMSLRDVRKEYSNIDMLADPRVQTTEEIEAELKELLGKGKISQGDYDRFVYTMGYHKQDCIRSGEEVKSTKDLGKEVLDELENTQYIDETEAGMDRDEKHLEEKTTGYTQEN